MHLTAAKLSSANLPHLQGLGFCLCAAMKVMASCTPPPLEEGMGRARRPTGNAVIGAERIAPAGPASASANWLPRMKVRLLVSSAPSSPSPG
jgi:hypothetical protein